MNTNVRKLRRHWQRVLYRVDFTLAVLVTVSEIIVFLILYYENLIEQTLPVYLRDYLIGPSGIIWLMFGILTLVYFGCKRKLENPNISQKDEDRYNKYINFGVLAVLTCICGITAYVHYVFNVTISLYVIPVFLSCVFYSEVLSKTICFVGEAGIIITAIHRLRMTNFNDPLIFPDVIISMVLVFSIGYVTTVLVKHMLIQNKDLIDAKEEAEIANKAKSNFLARMSHEIRTPINAVVGMDEMILRESTEPEIIQYARDIKGAASSLLSIINDILDISKIESGKMEIIPVEYNLPKLIKDVYNTVYVKANEKGLKLILDIQDTLPTVLVGDDIRIRQVIVNILNNAIKYTHIGVVTLSVSGTIDTYKNIVNLRVSVKDTGIGIKDEDLPKIRETFKRVDEKSNRNIEGTGLGLSITLELLELMHSNLEVVSDYGKGSEFYFTLAQDIVDATEIGDYEKKYQEISSKESKEEISEWTAEDARILVVDDSSINLKVFCSLLKKRKMKIDTATSGKEAIEKVCQSRYVIIFMDHMMPEMDGIETFREMKKRPDNKSIDSPVVILTANAIVGVKDKYISEGFSDYISKPMEVEKLESIIKGVLNI